MHITLSFSSRWKPALGALSSWARTLGMMWCSVIMSFLPSDL